MPSPRPKVRRGRYNRRPQQSQQMAQGVQVYQHDQQVQPFYSQEPGGIVYPHPDWHTEPPYQSHQSGMPGYGLSPSELLLMAQGQWYSFHLWAKDSLWKWSWSILGVTFVASAVVGSSYRMGHWVDWVNPFHWMSVVGAGSGNAVRGANQKLDSVNVQLEQTGGVHIQQTYSTGTPPSVSTPLAAPLPAPSAVDSSYRVDPSGGQ